MAWSNLILEACISSVMSCEVNAVPLSVRSCLGTYACWVKIWNSARTTEVVSGLHSGTANM